MNKLMYGQTPWDNKTREELLRDVQRMYAAIVALDSCMAILKWNKNNGFWGSEGSGGQALEMSRQILYPLHDQYDGSEEIYRSFFRYAVDLLFDQTTGIRTGFGWTICDTCGVMVGALDGRLELGNPCNMASGKDCTGTMRALAWDDIKPA